MPRFGKMDMILLKRVGAGRLPGTPPDRIIFAAGPFLKFSILSKV